VIHATASHQRPFFEARARIAQAQLRNASALIPLTPRRPTVDGGAKDRHWGGDILFRGTKVTMTGPGKADVVRDFTLWAGIRGYLLIVYRRSYDALRTVRHPEGNRQGIRR
jgi:hypothetical protein